MRFIRRLFHALRPFIRSLTFFFLGTPTRKWITITCLFGLAPLATNSYLAWFAYFTDSEDAFKTEFNCGLTAAAAFGGTAANLIAFALLKLGPKKTLLFIFLQSIVVILAFAGIYQGHGINAGPTLIQLKGEEHQWTSLYFSIVTWTTLGYGDFVPPHDLRLVAACEALLGYFTFGMMVGLLTSVAVEPKPA